MFLAIPVCMEIEKKVDICGQPAQNLERQFNEQLPVQFQAVDEGCMESGGGGGGG
jgi:hypothetical protein